MPKLFENLWAKLAAVLLAFLLWFHVATDKTYQYETSLRLAQIDLNDEIALNAPPPDEFKIIVSATGKRLLRSDWKNSGLRLMIDRSRAGRANISFDHNNLSLVKSDNIELINIISPRETVLEFDRKINKEVPIKSMVTIIPDKGFILNSNDSLDPAMVTITGPRRLLNTIDSIETNPEYVEGIRNNLSMRVPLAYPDVYGLEIFPDTVGYIVDVTPIKTKVFSDIIIHLTHGPTQSDSIVSIQPILLEIRVGGIPKYVDSLQSNILSASVDYRQFDSLGYAPIKITIPNSVSIISQSADSVKLIRK
ncbi:MAG: YbbR-like domain-containing protein [candidate division Zixibacteria bacterium]|nr:YbbR-like domain-containing protein [candidate division Zixibacteria bacterium]